MAGSLVLKASATIAKLKASAKLVNAAFVAPFAVTAMATVVVVEPMRLVVVVVVGTAGLFYDPAGQAATFGSSFVGMAFGRAVVVMTVEFASEPTFFAAVANAVMATSGSAM